MNLFLILLILKLVSLPFVWIKIVIPSTKPKKNIVLFDGVCKMCNGFVNFLIDNDKDNNIMLCTLQSESGKKLLEQYNLKNDLSTMVLIQDEKCYTKSTAVLKTIGQLGNYFKYLCALLSFPVFLRDFCYGIIAKNRYFIFGKNEECRRPTKEFKSKFVEWD